MDGTEVILASGESKPPITQYFAASPIVAVSVGKEKATYQVHKGILIKECPFFARMFASGMAEAQTNQVELPEDSYEAFEHFVTWIYFSKSTPGIDDDNLPIAMECWTLADKFGMAKWQNTIISSLMTYWNSSDLLTRDVSWVLENVSPTSTLYRLVIDQFVWQVATSPKDFKNSKANRKELEQVLTREEFPVADFVIDLLPACKRTPNRPSKEGANIMSTKKEPNAMRNLEDAEDMKMVV